MPNTAQKLVPNNSQSDISAGKSVISDKCESGDLLDGWTKPTPNLAKEGGAACGSRLFTGLRGIKRGDETKGVCPASGRSSLLSLFILVRISAA